MAFELGGDVGFVGATVEIPFSITSSHEFVGFSAGVSYPTDLVRPVGVEELVRPGLVRLDTPGFVGLALSDTVRRIAEEGERREIARLRFEVLPAAAGVDEIEFAFGAPEPFSGYVMIRHERGADWAVPTTTRVEPTRVPRGIVRIQSAPTSRGDVDLDYERTLTDAVIILGDLFLGESRTLCETAADVNADGRVNVSDPVALLGFLFQGGPAPPDGETISCR